MWLLAVEAPTTSQDSRTAITLAIFGLLTAVLVPIVGGLFGLLTARQNRTRPTPDAQPVPVGTGQDLTFRDYVVRELAKGEQRDDDNDDRDDVQDRRILASEHRLDAMEWYLDLTNPEWRHGPR